ncbi:MAG: hypothetical protein EA379_04155 [Phycisphaerales bacterium]|nr:MAG: hypothetical protein EA379_04155 [Phycisphaerales bacterium]
MPLTTDDDHATADAPAADPADGAAVAAAPKPSARAHTPDPVRVPVAPDAVFERLDRAARKGDMPGLRAGDDGQSFRLRIFGELFDRELVGEARPDTASPGESEIVYRVRLLPLMPAVTVVTLVFVIWPGVWLTDSMLSTYFPGFTRAVPTWWWYMPLTVLPLPWAVRTAWRRSCATANEEIVKAAERVRTALGAR